MKSRNVLLAAAALILALVPASAQQAPQIWYSWSPKPVPLTPWKSPNKPIWRLNEILADHKGRPDWVQPIVRDKDYAADYISMGPGSKTKPQFWADDRIFWYVASGHIRYHIQGQEPFVASKGWLVQVPYRNIYWMEQWEMNPVCAWKSSATIAPHFIRQRSMMPVPRPQHLGSSMYWLATARRLISTTKSTSRTWTSGVIL